MGLGNKISRFMVLELIPEFTEQRGKCVRWPVSRVLFPAFAGRWPFLWDARYRTPRATDPDGNPETGRAPSLFGLAPGGACRAASVAVRAVRSCRTVSPLPVFAPFGASPGGLFSVALSLGSPPPDVIRHRVSVEPGLSSRLRRFATLARQAHNGLVAP